MNKVNSWLNAFRLKTLPLAFSCIIMGSVLAFKNGSFNLSIFTLSLFTTLCLQILSNLANDYGDAVKGTDNDNRLGPKRAVQSGIITKESMFKGVIVASLFSFGSGLSLLYISFSTFSASFVMFLVFGLLSIAAAIKYTVGKNAFGYMSLGDIFVFLFFGLLGVIGVYYLHVQSLEWSIVLPAISVGLFSAGVLNLNNLRDIDNDKDNNKITIAVRLGEKKARYYHFGLIVIAWVCQLFFVYKNGVSSWEWLFVLSLPIFILNVHKALTFVHPKELIPSLKQLAMGTFVFTLLYAIGLIISHA